MTTLLLLAVEGCFRMVGIGAAEEVAFYIANWSYQWAGDFYLLGPGGEVNADGVRDRPHALGNPGGALRIVCLGDSVTFGYGYPAALSYPAALERRLQEGGHDAEVFNVALPGWSIRQQRKAWRAVARKYRPDHVVLGFCLNDVPEMQNNLARPSAVLAWFWRRSNLVRALLRPREAEIHRVEELFDVPQRPNVDNAWELYLRELDEFRSELGRDGVGLTILVVPFRFQVEAGAPAPRPQEILKDYCRERGVRCVDLLPLLSPYGEAAWRDYDHLSPLGALRTAEALVGAGIVSGGDGSRAGVGGRPREGLGTRARRAVPGAGALQP